MWAAAAVFAAALLLHLGLALQYRDDPFRRTYVADALSYDRWAARMASQGLAAEPAFHQSPLFPLVLAGLYRVVPEGGRVASALGLQIVLAALAVAGLVVIGRAWFGSLGAGIAAAVLALLYGPLAFHSQKLLPLSLALATQVAGLLALARARACGTPPAAALCGASWGLACLARAEVLLFTPLVALALFWPQATPRRTPRLALALAYALGLAFVLAPAGLHNARRGAWAPVASSAGENLFIGNQRGASGGYVALEAGAGDIFSQRALATERAEAELGRPLSPGEVSSYWMRRAAREVLDDPRGWLVLELRKLARLLHPGEPTDLYSFALEADRYLPLLFALPVGAWTVLLLSGVGLLRAHRAGLSRRAWPLAALVLTHAALLLVFFVDARLRLPFYFFLLPYAGLAVTQARQIARARGGRARVIVLGLAAVALTIVSALAARETPRDLVRLASVLSIQNRLDESLEVLAPLLQGEGDPVALDQAGWVLQKRGDFAEARERYLAALARDLPAVRASDTETRLGMVSERLGLLAEAKAAHDRAVAAAYADAGTFYERGMFRSRRGDAAGAILDWREAARRDPGWPAPRAALAAAGEPPPRP